MRDFITKIKVISRNELVCMGVLITSLSYTMFYTDIENPLQFSLSEIGRSNRFLFYIWCILSGCAILLNIHRFYARTGYNTDISKNFLYASIIFLIMTFLNMSKDPIIFYWIHIATAILFAVLSFASISLCLIHLSRNNKKYRILTTIFFSLIFIDTIFLIIYKKMALFESIPLILGYVVLFFTNYTDFFKIKS